MPISKSLSHVFLALHVALFSVGCGSASRSTADDDGSDRTSSDDSSGGVPSDEGSSDPGTSNPSNDPGSTQDAGGEYEDPGENFDGGNDGGGNDVECPSDVPRVPLAVGDPISGVGAILGIGNSSVNGECTVGAIGVDKQGRKVALTAGHCADVVDAVMVKNGLKEQAQGKKSVKIGRARVFVKSIPAKDTFNKSNVTDVLAFELDCWVDLVPSGLTVRAPVVGDKVYRKGNGFTSPLTSKGTVGVVTGNDFGTDMADGASAGDSGGPVLSEDDKFLFGIVSRPYKDSSDKRIMATRVDAVLQELDKAGGVGAGFVAK